MNLEINDQFKHALHLMNDTNSHVFITGKAGTGKSTLLMHFRNTTPKPIAVVAPTGVSAVNIGGQTIHSFFGWGPDITMDKIKMLRGDKKKVVGNLSTLVIDEVSMVRADIMDCIDQSLRMNRGRDEPFGGVQMIFFGDLFQLSPIVTRDEREAFSSHYTSPYFFSSRVFDSCEYEIIELEKIYRQKNQEFIDLLGRIRNGNPTTADLDKLNSRFNPDFAPEKGDMFIHLTTINKRVDEINSRRLDEIKGHQWEYEATTTGEFMKNSFPTDKVVKLKTGAQLMMLNNDSDGRWVNGTLGTLKGIISGDECDILRVKLQDGNTVEVEANTWDIFKYSYDKKNKQITTTSIGSFTQYPVRLAWAITIHKAQGKTFENVILDLGRGAFAPGQTYVALSRCVSLDGLILTSKIKKGHIFTDGKVRNFINRCQFDDIDHSLTSESIVEILKECIHSGKRAEIDYLKGGDIREKRLILPEIVGNLQYKGKKYLGVRGYCFTRKAMRAFRIDRVLGIKLVG